MRSPSRADDYDELIRRARGKRLALLSESSHGTREFHARRGRITRRLIDELGFDVVTVEADSPDASQVNSFVRGDSSAPTAERALGGVQRFPTWMWRNDDVVGLLEWMRGRNASLPGFDHAGFYGIDLYSLHSFHGGAKCAAGLVKNAERYYRSMFRGRVTSWNLRDTRMAIRWTRY